MTPELRHACRRISTVTNHGRRPSLNTSILRSPFSRSTLTVSAVEGSARPTSGSFPMHSMVLDAPRRPLRLEQRPDPKPGPGEVRVRVEACAVCRTDLHIVDGELPLPRLPLVPGHEIVGVIEEVADDVGNAVVVAGKRVGIPWLAHTCGHCAYCNTGRENLCDAPLFTGHGRDGGFATHVVADAAYCL